jgi:hypothetical protein
MRRKEKEVDWLMSCEQSEDDAKRTLSFYFGLSISSKDCDANYVLQFSPLSSKSERVDVQLASQRDNRIVSSRGIVDDSFFFVIIIITSILTDRSTMRVDYRHRISMSKRRCKVEDMTSFVFTTLHCRFSLHFCRTTFD